MTNTNTTVDGFVFFLEAPEEKLVGRTIVADTGDLRVQGVLSRSLASSQALKYSLDGGIQWLSVSTESITDTHHFTIDLNGLAAGAHRIEVALFEGENHSQISRQDIYVDTLPYEVSLNSCYYNALTNQFTLTGNGLQALLLPSESSTTDIKTRVNWSKLSWDIEGTATTFGIQDIASVQVVNGSNFLVTFTQQGAEKLEGAGAGSGNHVSVSAGFLQQASGADIGATLADEPIRIFSTTSGVVSTIDLFDHLVIDFGEVIHKGAGVIQLNDSNGIAIEQFDIATSPRVSIDGTKVTISPSWKLRGSTEYSLSYDTGTFIAADESSIEGVTHGSTLGFLTGFETTHVLGFVPMRTQYPGDTGETQGMHSVLFMPSAFIESPTAPYGKYDYEPGLDPFKTNLISDIEKYTFNRVSDYYMSTSQGSMTFNGVTTHLLTVPLTHSLQQALSGFGLSRLSLPMELAKDAATRAGYSTDNNLSATLWTEYLDYIFAIGGGNSVWLVLNVNDSAVFAHEAGHALGLGHASAQFWGGSVAEYGNVLDNMGTSPVPDGDFNATFKDKLGWIEPEAYLREPGPGIYRLNPLDQERRAVGDYYGFSQTIPKDQFDSNPIYTLEYRTTLTEDYWNNDLTPLRDQVIVMRNGIIIDRINAAPTMADAGIFVGETWNIPGSDAYFSVIGKGPDNSYLDIVYMQGPFDGNRAPTARVEASSTQVSAGASVTFTTEAFDADGDALIYFWSFSDGARGHGASYTRTFAQTAATDVVGTLTVSDMRGGTAQHAITIHAGAASTDGTSQATGTVVRDASDPIPTVSIHALDAATTEGGADARFVVTRTGNFSNDLTVKLNYAGTATRDADFTAPASVTIKAGDSDASFQVSAVNDTLQESREGTTVSIASDASPYIVSGRNAFASIVILDDDAPVVTLETIDGQAVEGSNDRAMVLFHRSGPTTDTLTVYYGLTGDAYNGGDYNRLDGQITFASGESTVALPITAIDDEVGEQTEQVTLFLTSFDQLYSVGAEYTATVKLMDNHDRPVVNLVHAQSVMTEGETAQLTFEVVGGDGTPLIVEYSLSGTASASDHSAMRGWVEIPTGGRHTQTVAFDLLNDHIVEGYEVLDIVLKPSDQYIVGKQSTVHQIIRDADQNFDHGEIVVSAFPLVSGQSIDETKQGDHIRATDGTITTVQLKQYDTALRFYVSRADPYGGEDMHVHFGLGGTATPGEDYTGRLLVMDKGKLVVLNEMPSLARNGNTLTIPGHANGVIVELIPVNDTVAEGTETVTLTLESVTEASSGQAVPIGMANEATLHLDDDDTSSTIIGFQSLFTVIEENTPVNARTYEIPVVLNQTTAQPVTVGYYVQSATAQGLGADYTFLDSAGNATSGGLLTFEPGETQQTIRITVQSDSIPEGMETLILSLEHPTNASLEVPKAADRLQHTIYLFDDIPNNGALHMVKEQRWLTTDVFDKGTWANSEPDYESVLGYFATDKGTTTRVSRIFSGDITADQTGDYTFYLTNNDSDGYARFYLTDVTDSSAPGDKELKITSVDSSYQDWTNAAQATISLTEGHTYHIEIQQRKSSAISLGWSKPGETLVHTVAPFDTNATIEPYRVDFVESLVFFREGDHANVLITLDRANPNDSVLVTVGVDASKSNASEADYALSTTTLIFAPGEITKSIDLNLLQDTIAEGVERLALQIISADGAMTDPTSTMDVWISDALAPAIQPPTSTLSVSRDASNGAILGTIAASTQAGQTVTAWSIEAGNPRQPSAQAPGAFSIDPSGLVTVVNVDALPIGEYALRLLVKAIADDGRSASQWVTVATGSGTEAIPAFSQGYTVEPIGAFSLAASAFTDTGTVREIENGDITRDNTLSLHGTAHAGNKVRLYDASTFIGETTARSDHTWEFTTSPLTDGSHVFRAEVINASGEMGLTDAVSFQIHSQTTLPALNLVTADEAPGVTSATSISAIEAVTTSGSGTVVYSKAGNLYVADVGSGAIRLINHEIDDATAPASAEVQWAGVSSHGDKVVFGTNQPAAFGFDDLHVNTASAYSDLVLLDRTTDTFSLITSASDPNTSNSIQSGFVGFSGDGRFVVYATEHAERIGNFTAPQKAAPVWSLSDGTFILSAGTTVSTSVRVADVDPTNFHFQIGGLNVDAIGAKQFKLERWNDVASLTPTGLPTLTQYITSTEAPINYSTTSKYSSTKLSGNYTASVSGEYSFYASGNSDSELFINGTSRLKFKTTEGSVVSWSEARKVVMQLSEGETISIDVHMRDTNNSNHLSLAVVTPNNKNITPLNIGMLDLPELMAVTDPSSVSREAESLTFWIEGYESSSNTTKAVKIQLSDASNGLLAKVMDARYLAGDQTHSTTDWTTSGTQVAIAEGNDKSGLGVNLIRTDSDLSTAMLSESSQPAATDVIAYDTQTGSSILLSHSAAASHTQSSAADVSDIHVSGDGQYVVFSALDAGRLGNDGTAFHDSEPLIKDWFSSNIATGDIRLLSHAGSNATQSAGVEMTQLGTSEKAPYTIFSVKDASPFGFIDANAALDDLIAVNLNSGISQLVTHNGVNALTTSASTDVTFEKIAGNYVYFSAKDATKFGFSDGYVNELDLLRFNLSNGSIELLTHTHDSLNQSIKGNARSYLDTFTMQYTPGSVIASSDGRYVCFAVDVASVGGSSGTYYSDSFKVDTGNLTFITDTTLGSIRGLDAEALTGDSFGPGRHAGWSPAFFTPDNTALVWQTTQMRGIATTDEKVFSTVSDKYYGNAVLVLDLSNGVKNSGAIQASTVLTHGPGGASDVIAGSDIKLLGISNDSRFAFIEVKDASKYGNSGVRFVDTSPTSPDIVAIDILSQEIVLLTGSNGQSFGLEFSLLGSSTNGHVVLSTPQDLDGIITSSGTVVDNNTGVDIISWKGSVLELAGRDQSGFARLLSRVDSGSEYILLRNGIPVDRKIANSDGLIAWEPIDLTSEGVFSLLDPNYMSPVVGEYGFMSSTLVLTWRGITGLTDASVTENVAYTSTTPSLSGSTGAVTWTVEGSDADKFTVDAFTGVVSMIARDFEAPADADTNNVYTYTLKATDAGGNTASQDVFVTVTDVIETSTLAIGNLADASLTENVSYTSTTPSLSGSIGAVTWTVEGADAARFTVDASTGVVSMIARDFEAPADADTNNLYTYTIKATDADGNTASQAVFVTVTDVIETSTLAIGNLTDASVTENVAYTSTTPSLSGSIGAVAWTMEGADADKFTVDAFTGVVSMIARDFEAPADADTNNVYTYTLKATDADSNTASLDVFVTVVDADDSSEVQLRTKTVQWNTNLPIHGVVLSDGITSAVSDQNGEAFLSLPIDQETEITAQKEPSSSEQDAINAHVNLSDAIGILKMIAGRPLSQNSGSIRHLQALAADYDGNGHVQVSDAIRILRHAVGLSAPAPSWIFVNAESLDADAQSEYALLPGVPPAILVNAESTLSNHQINLIGYIRGDVDGSYKLATVTPEIYDAYFDFGNSLNKNESLRDHSINIGTNGIPDNHKVTLTLGNGEFFGTVISGKAEIVVSTNALQALSQGTVLFTVNITDTTGNSLDQYSGSFFYDAIAPQANLNAVIDDVGLKKGPLSSETSTDDTTLVLSGTNEVGSIVKVYNGANELGDATVSGTNWTYSATVANGTTYAFNVKETDVAGNVSDATSNFFVSVDTVAPSITVFGVDLSSDTGKSQTDLVTKIASQTISAELSAPLNSGDALFGSVDGGLSWIDITEKVNGTSLTWTGATLIGSNSILLKVRDPAGNEGDATDAIDYVLDTIPPTIIGSAFDFGAKLTLDNVTSDANLAVVTSGVDDGDLVRLILNNSTYTAAVNNNSATITVPAADLQHMTGGILYYTVDADDAAGNSAIQYTGSFTSDLRVVDTVAPTFLSSAIVDDPNQVTITYSENIHTADLDPSVFKLTVGGAVANISSVSVLGSSIVLHTTSPIPAGYSVALSYTGDSFYAVRDMHGNRAEDLAFTLVRGAAPNAGAQVTSVSDSGRTEIDVLLDGNKWGSSVGTGAVLTYSFPSWSESIPAFHGAYGSAYSFYNEPDANTVFGLNSAQRANVRTALDHWGQVSNLTFLEVSESDSQVGDLRFAFSSEVSGSTWGWGWLPSQVWPSGGDIWINPDVSEASWAPGTDHFSAMLHEIGHALGFKHPFEESPRIGYDNQALTVMSYTQAPGAIWWTANGSIYEGIPVSPESPMIYDIAAAQYVYGINNFHNAGDTTYTFDEHDPFFMTIWDGGGDDTIVLSNFILNCVIDLNPGSYSTVKYYERISPDILNDVENNLGIAYNCWIENAVGGTGDDLLIGNALPNKLTGGVGVDTFRFQFGESIATACDVITDFDNDKISIYSANTKVAIRSAGANITGTSTVAAYDSTTLIADLSKLFPLSSLSDAVAAVESAINAASTPIKGQSALFNYVNDAYLYVSDGFDGVGSDDILIKLEGKHVSTGGSISSGELEIAVVNAPSISITGVNNSNLPENTEYRSAKPTATGANGMVTWTIAGPDASHFSVDQHTGVVTLTPRNFESPTDNGADNVYNYHLVATDANNSRASLAVAVTVTDVHEQSSLSFSNVKSDISVAENSVYLSITPSVTGGIGTLNYTITGDDKDLFSINTFTGVVQMLPRDYEEPIDSDRNNIYSYSLIATDSDGNTTSQAVSVTITDVAELSINVAQTYLSIPENSVHPNNFQEVSGALTSVTWSIGGADAQLFTINSSNGDVYFKNEPDFEQPIDSDTNNVYSYTLIVTDQQNNSATQTITVRVTDVIEQSNLSIESVNETWIDENTSYTTGEPTVVGAIGRVTWSIGGEDAHLFTVNTSTGVVNLAARDYETPSDFDGNNRYVYTLTATDSDGNSATQTIDVYINDVTETDTLSIKAFHIKNIQSKDPSSAAYNTADLRTGFEFTLTEPVESLTGTIHLKTIDGFIHESFTAASENISILGDKINITPKWSLLPSTNYYFEISTASIRSITGSTNASVSPEVVSFHTGVETFHSTIAEQFYQYIPGSNGEEQFGDHYTITVATDYPDKYEEAYNNLTQVSDMSAASLYFADTSYGNMSMNVSLAPDFMIPYTLWAAVSDSIGSTGDIRSLAKKQLAELGILPPSVNLVVYNSHGWLKVGTDAGASVGGGDFASNAWTGMDVIIHEGGHALGMAHSNLYAVYKDDNIASYGNSWDIQGGGYGFGAQYILPYLRESYDHYKEENRDGLGWIEETVLLKDPSPGTYRLYAYDDAYFSSDRIHGVTIETRFADGVIEYENDVDGVATKSEKVVLTIEHRANDEKIDAGILITRDTYLIAANYDQNGDGVWNKDDNGSAVAPVLLGQTIEYDRNKYLTVVNNGEGYVDLVFNDGVSSNTSPKAEVSLSTDKAKNLEYVDFSAEAYDADGDALSYFWQFTDGFKTNQASFSRYFDLETLGSESTVSFSLIVSDMRGGTTKLSDTIYIGSSYTTANPIVIGALPPAVVSAVPTLKIASDEVLVNEGIGDFTLTISDINETPVGRALTVPLTYTFVDVNGNDVTNANATRLRDLPSAINIDAGKAHTQLSLHLNDDATVQDIALLKVALGSGADYQLDTRNSSVIVQLQDDDRPVVSLRVLDSTATEASRDSAIVEFDRTGDLSKPLDVYYAFAGSATYGADYAPLSGTIYFNAGESKAYLPIHALDDPWGETRETLYIFTTSLDGTYNVNPSERSGVVSIYDNNDRPSVNVWSDGFVVEDGSLFDAYYLKEVEPSFKFSVVGSVDQPINIKFRIGGNATLGTDYAVNSDDITYLGENIYELIADGSKENIYEVKLVPINDNIKENSELVIIDIIEDVQYQIGNKSQADMVIHDDDGGPLVSVSRNVIGDVSENFGTGNLFKIYSDSSFYGTVNYRISGGSAEAGSDFSISNSIVLGGRSKTVSMTIHDDDVAEGVETIKFELLPGSGYSLSNINTASVNIIDNDAHSVTVGFNQGLYLATEGDVSSQILAILVTLSGPSSEDIFVDYVAAGGSALGMGTDWAFWDPSTNKSIAPGQLHFEPGDTSKNIYVKVFNDSINERIEEIDFALKLAQNADIDLSSQTTRLIISDNKIREDGLLTEERWFGTAVFNDKTWSSSAPYEQTKTDQYTKNHEAVLEEYSRRIYGTITAKETGSYTFRLTNDTNDRSRAYISTDESEENKIEFFPAKDRNDLWDEVSISFEAGREYYIEVQQRADDSTDYVLFEWRTPNSDAFYPVSKSSIESVSGTSGGHTVRFVTNEVSCVEGSEASVYLSLDRPATHAISVDLAIQNSGDDFVQSAYRVDFGVGEISKKITLLASDDAINEPLERFNLTIVGTEGAWALENQDLELAVSDTPRSWLPTRAVVRGDYSEGAVVFDLSTVSIDDVTWTIVNGNPEIADGSPAFAIDAVGRIRVLNPDAMTAVTDTISLGIKGVTGTGGELYLPFYILSNPAPGVVETVYYDRQNNEYSYHWQDWNMAPLAQRDVTNFEISNADHVNSDYQTTHRFTSLFRAETSGTYKFIIVGKDEPVRLYLGQSVEESSKLEIANYAYWKDYYSSADVISLAGGNQVDHEQFSSGYELQAGELYWIEVVGTSTKSRGEDLKILHELPNGSIQPIPIYNLITPTVQDILHHDWESRTPSLTWDTHFYSDIDNKYYEAGQVVSDPTLELSGMAEAGTIVHLYVNGVKAKSTIPDTSGNWNLVSDELPEGVNTLQISVGSSSHGYLTEALRNITIKTREVLNDARIATLNRPKGDLLSDSAITSNDLRLSVEGGYVAAIVDNISAFGSATQSYTDNNTSSSDIILFSTRDHSQTLVTASKNDPMASFGAHVDTMVMSPSGQYVVYRTTDINNLYTGQASEFTSGSVNIVIYDVYTGVSKLATHGIEPLISTAKSGDIIAITDQYVIVQTEQSYSYGGFTGSVTTNYTDLIQIDLATGAQHLISGDGNNRIASSQADVQFEGIANNGMLLIMSANDASKLISQESDTNGQRDFFSVDLASGHLIRLTPNVASGATLIDIDETGTFAVFKVSNAATFGFADGSSSNADYISVNLIDGQAQLLTGTLSNANASAKASTGSWTKVENGYLYFTINNSAVFSSTFTEARPDRATLMRSHLDTGVIEMVSHNALSTTTGLKGYFDESFGILSSTDGRYVAYMCRMDSDADNGGFTAHASGRGIFVVDTQTGVVKLANYGLVNGIQGIMDSATAVDATHKRLLHLSDDGDLVFQTSYINSLADFSVASGLSSTDDHGLVYFNFSSGAIKLLNHGGDGKQMTAESEYLSVSEDGLSVYFTTQDASKFRDAKGQIVDAAKTVDDIFKVSLVTGDIELVSGSNSASYGQPVTYLGETSTAETVLAIEDISTVLGGSVTDNNPSGVDILIHRDSLLDLTWLSDNVHASGGTRSDNVTSEVMLEIQAYVEPGMSVYIKLNGIRQEAVNANLDGLARWHLSNLGDGDYLVSLHSVSPDLPVGIESDATLHFTIDRSDAQRVALIASNTTAEGMPISPPAKGELMMNHQLLMSSQHNGDQQVTDDADRYFYAFPEMIQNSQQIGYIDLAGIIGAPEYSIFGFGLPV